MFYSLIRLLAKLTIHIKFRVEIIGKEHIPANGNFILAANHVSNYDPVLLMGLVNRKIHFLAKKELFRHPFSRWFFTRLHAIPVDRFSGMAIRPVRQGLRVIHGGEVIGIFPEGTRCRNGKRVKPKGGVGFFAVKTEVPILPVALVNIGAGLWRPIKVVFGEPILVSRLGLSDYSEIAEAVMERIRQLMAEASGPVPSSCPALQER